MAMFAEDAWKERLNWREELVVVLLRNELESCLNIFKCWRGRGNNCGVSNETSVKEGPHINLRSRKWPRELGVVAALDAVLAVLQACWLAGRQASMHGDEAVAIGLARHGECTASTCTRASAPTAHRFRAEGDGAMMGGGDSRVLYVYS